MNEIAFCEGLNKGFGNGRVVKGEDSLGEEVGCMGG